MILLGKWQSPYKRWRRRTACKRAAAARRRAAITETLRLWLGLNFIMNRWNRDRSTKGNCTAKKKSVTFAEDNEYFTLDEQYSEEFKLPKVLDSVEVVCYDLDRIFDF